MNTIRATFHRLIADESGQDLIEYALVVALIGLAAVSALKSLATEVIAVFAKIESTLSTAIQ